MRKTSKENLHIIKLYSNSLKRSNLIGCKQSAIRVQIHR